MKRELALVSILFLALQLQGITAECPNYVQYKTTLVPACEAEDMIVSWPNYENSATFYKCKSIGNAVLMNCAAGTYFCYVRQSCGPCSNYLPPLECSRLPTESSPNCIAIGAETPAPAPTSTSTTTTVSIPTPNAPTTTVSIPTPNAPTTTTTTTTTITTALPVPPTPPTDGISIPPPPSPATDSPDIPGPPTPAATPPSAPATPPALTPPIIQ